jgi:hypothetical protein
MPIEHPHPKGSTIKRLYAQAFDCGMEGCSEPLYREDPASGAWVLNSRICHIHARSENGPRWDGLQSAEDNRADGNLILMCTEHASTIDDPQTQAAYGPELLRTWKREQIDRYRKLVVEGAATGWQLTNAMAAEAGAASFKDVGFAIVNSSFDLAGRGGNAPGAGGGGGGAVGPGARGGNGGKGGRMHDADGNPLPDDHDMGWLPTFEGEQPPGSGGGGGGAVGENAIGGDGGDGGDYATGIFDLEEGDVCQVTVGRAGGGRDNYLPGEHREDGEDSAFTVHRKNGDVLELLRAKGGASARCGTLPDDWRQVGENELEGGFSIPALFTVRAGEFQTGSIFCLGATPGLMISDRLPVDLTAWVVCMAQWSALRAGNIYGIQLCLNDPDGVERARVALSMQPGPEERSWMWIAPIGARIAKAGAWTIAAQSGGHVLAKIFIAVAEV